MSVEKTQSWKLFKAPVENREHMLIYCPAFQRFRTKWWFMLDSDDMFDVKPLLDQTERSETNLGTVKTMQLLCFKIHVYRLKFVNTIYQSEVEC